MKEKVLVVISIAMLVGILGYVFLVIKQESIPNTQLQASSSTPQISLQADNFLSPPLPPTSLTKSTKENCFSVEQLDSSSDTSAWKEYRGSYFSMKYPESVEIKKEEATNWTYSITLKNTHTTFFLELNFPLEEQFKVDLMHSPTIAYELLSDTWWNYEGLNGMHKTDFRSCIPNTAGKTDNGYPVYKIYGPPFYIVLMRNLFGTEERVHYTPTIITLRDTYQEVEGDDFPDQGTIDDQITIIENMLKTINALPSGYE